MALDTIGSIANHIVKSFDNLPTGVSGNMVEIVDMARIHVQNYTGQTIGSNSISSQFAPAILEFAKADAMEASVAEGNSADIRISDLSISESSIGVIQRLRKNAESKLQALGMKRRFARSLS